MPKKPSSPAASSPARPSPGPAASSKKKKRGQKKGRGRAALGLTADDGPMRMCIVCRATGSPTTLLRFARSRDGEVGFDVRGRLPGRGAWVCATPQCLQAATEPGHGGFARAFDAAVVFAGPDLRREVEEALRADVRERLGLLRRQGDLILGRDDVVRRIPELLGIGLASDLSENSRHELHERAAGVAFVPLPTMAELSAAVGHDRAVGVVGLPKRGGQGVIDAAWRLARCQPSSG